MLVDYELISQMLFFDMESVAEYGSYELLPETEKTLWDRVSKRYLGEKYEEASLEQKINCYKTYAGLYPEFAKVVSISYGVVKVNIGDPENSEIDVRIIIAPDEKTILSTFVTVLNYAYSKNIDRMLAGHNIAGFDIPFLVKRIIKNGLVVPTIIVKIIEAKPWEQKIYDTIRVWKFGSTEFVSLDCICSFLGIPTPKVGVVTGKTLNAYYYDTTRTQEETLKNIGEYNKADVFASAKVVMKLAKH